MLGGRGAGQIRDEVPGFRRLGGAAARGASREPDRDLRRRGIAALEEAERELEALGDKLMQQTYFAVPKEQLSLEPQEELTLS